MYIYEHCLGYFYTSDVYYEKHQLYHPECCDYDALIGEVNTKEDMYKLLMDYKTINPGHTFEYILNFIEETFGKLKGSEKYSYPENLFRAYYEEKEIPRFRPLVDKYGIKPYDWDIMQEILNIRSQHEQ